MYLLLGFEGFIYEVFQEVSYHGTKLTIQNQLLDNSGVWTNL
jgi:hypothetical protein